MENKLNEEKKALLKPDCDLSIYEANELKSRLVSLLEDNDILELDISNIITCDTAGLQLLCSAKKTADSMGKKLIITGISREVEAGMLKTGITMEMISQDGGAGCQR
jgi:anti-sigma B factor antagonist